MLLPLDFSGGYQGRDINLDIDQIVSLRQFCNKLWQATFFVMLNLKDYVHSGTMTDAIAALSDSSVTAREQWLMSRLNTTITTVTAAFNEYAFSTACSAMYDFFQKDLCDNYIVRDVQRIWLCGVAPLLPPNVGPATMASEPDSRQPWRLHSA